MGWFELMMRSNTANSEASLLNADVTFLTNIFWKQYMKDSKAFEVTSIELDQKLADLSTLFERKSTNANRREEKMRVDFEAELLKA